jgi:hypothetical protein
MLNATSPHFDGSTEIDEGPVTSALRDLQIRGHEAVQELRVVREPDEMLLAFAAIGFCAFAAIRVVRAAALRACMPWRR